MNRCVRHRKEGIDRINRIYIGRKEYIYVEYTDRNRKEGIDRINRIYIGRKEYTYICRIYR